MTQTVVKMLFGSHLYGLSTPDSDTDYKTVIMPTRKQILLQKADFVIKKSTGNANAKNTSADVDDDSISLMRFIRLAAKGDTAAIDMLHAPTSALIETSFIWGDIVKNRSMFYTKSMKSYTKYVRDQAGKYGVKGSKLAVIEDILNKVKAVDNGMGNKRVGDFKSGWPISEYSYMETITDKKGRAQDFYVVAGRKFQLTLKIGVFHIAIQHIYDEYGARAQAAKNNDGVDWKAVSHALRAGYQAKYIYKDGGFSYPLPETDFLLQVKLGKLDYLTVVQPALEALVDEVAELAAASEYPDEVNREYVDNYISDVHNFIINNKEN